MPAWWWWWGSTPTTPAVGSSSLPLEDRLRRVTADDISLVTPSDVERMRREMSSADLQRAMRVLLEDNRYADVLAAAQPSSLRAGARGLTAAHRSCLTAIAKSNFVSLYNVLPYVTEAHLGEMRSVLKETR